MHIFEKVQVMENEMTSYMPEFILVGGMDVPKPPVDHLGRAPGHVCRGCDVIHAVRGESMPCFDREIVLLEEFPCIFQSKHIWDDLVFAALK